MLTLIITALVVKILQDCTDSNCNRTRYSGYFLSRKVREILRKPWNLEFCYVTEFKTQV